MTWAEVRARSERDGLFCASCSMNYDRVQMPCLRHCHDEAERIERAKRFQPFVKAEIERFMRMFDGY